MIERDCDRRWEVDAQREGRLGPKDVDAFERHARVCTTCSAARARSRELDAWLEGASTREPSAIDLRRVRIQVMRSGAVLDEPNSKGFRLAILAAGLSMVAGVGVGVSRLFRAGPARAIAASAPTSGPDDGATAFVANVTAQAGARWTQAREGSTEHVHLVDGALSIHVVHRADPQKFVVDLPDGTLEDRGTTFAVEAHDGHTTRVAVTEGLVAIRIAGADERVLHAGESWSPPHAAEAASSAVASAMPSASGAAPTVSSTRDDGSAGYAAAVASLRAHRYDEAAKAFATYVRLHPREPDAEDASYLEAVALAQSGNPAQAMSVAERHLVSYPQSFHRKEASLLVARLARDEGDCAKARKTLAPWLSEPADPEAIATVRACAAP